MACLCNGDGNVYYDRVSRYLNENECSLCCTDYASLPM